MTVNLTTGATYAAKATLIQTQIVALGGIFTGATFVYDTDAFLLTLAGSDAIPGSVFSDTAVGTDTDIAALLGMTAASGASYRQGHAAETIGSAIDEIVALATTGAPVALMLDADVPANFGTVNTRAALAAYAEANGFIYALLDTAEQAVSTGDTTSQTYGVFNRQQGQVAAVYSEPGQHPDVGLLALLSGQRLDETGSLVNPQGKPLPGVEPTTVSRTQLAELERKRGSVYTIVGGTRSFLGGQTGRDGYWIDAIWWLGWLRNRLEIDIWNAIRTSPKLTRTILAATLNNALEAGVANGGLQPGRAVTTATKDDIITTTGDSDFAGVLTSGYLVWVDPDPSAQDESNRISRFRVWCVAQSSFNRVLGDILFQN